MKINKKNILLSLILILCLGLWVMTYRLLGSIIFFICWFVYILKDRFKGKLLKTAIMLVLFAILFMKSEYNRYELTTTFYQPCWSPDGKQIAFFMVRDVTKYRPGMLGYIPTHIWHKEYLCTMDYDGKNFNTIAQLSRFSSHLSWSKSNKIVYGNMKELWLFDLDTLKEKQIMTIKDGEILDPWLSADQRYLGYVKYYQVPYLADGVERKKDNYQIILKDMQNDQEIFSLEQEDVKFARYRRFYGDYAKNLIVYEQERYSDAYVIYDLNTQKEELFQGKIDKLTFDMRSYSPDGSMYVGNGPSIWSSKDKKLIAYYYIKDQRSYLFNIFRK